VLTLSSRRGSATALVASDADFDPQPGDWVTVGDDEEPSIRGRVTRRDANKVWVQLELGLVSTDAASPAVGHG